MKEYKLEKTNQIHAFERSLYVPWNRLKQEVRWPFKKLLQSSRNERCDGQRGLRKVQEWGWENWVMDVMWGYGDGRSQRCCQVQEDTLCSLLIYEFYLFHSYKTITYRVAYPHWGHFETTGDLDACWVSCWPGRLILTAQSPWFQQFILIRGHIFWCYLRPVLQHIFHILGRVTFLGIPHSNFGCW